MLQIIGYIALTFGISFGIEYILPQYTDLTMFVPALIAVILTVLSKERIRELFGKDTFFNLFLGLLFPIGVFSIFLLITNIFALGSFGLSEEIIAYNDGSTLKAWGRFLTFGVPYFLLMNLLFAIGEEIGWRGYLLKKLGNHINNFWIKSLLVGTIWGIWHFPIYIALTTTTQSMLQFLINVCLISIVYTWLYERNNSIWTTTIAHAIHNMLFNTILPIITLTRNQHPLIWGEEGILVTTSCMCVISFGLILNRIRSGRIVYG